MPYKLSSVQSQALLAIALLSLAACAPVQRKNAATEVQAGQRPVNHTASPSSSAQQTPVATLMPQVSSEYRQFLETQLLCPTKSMLAVQAARKKSLQAGVISGKGKTEPAGWGESVYYPVNGELTVFGFKVIGLEFEGSDNGGGIHALIQASPQAMAKFYKERRITMKKINGVMGYSAKRPFDTFTLYEKKDNLIKMGCAMPIG